MDDQPPPDSNTLGGLNSTQVIVALIGAAATVVAALLAGFFGLADRSGSSPTAAPVAVPVALPSVTIDGPDEARLGTLTYFTIVSANADRAEWSIGGFNNNAISTVYPLAPSHQIQIEPTDATRVGDTFTLVVTVYDRSGATTTATHAFQIAAADPGG